jgi:hypothetical protein
MAIVFSLGGGAGGAGPAYRLQLFVVTDDFANDEVQEILGEFGVEIGLAASRLQPFDLRGLARGVGGGRSCSAFSRPTDWVCLNRSASV